MSQAASRKPTRPLLRYFGGKWELAPQIVALFPPHRIYTEVFGGAGSVLFHKAPSEIEIYNDLDSRLVNVFRVLRDPLAAAELERRLRCTPWSREEYKLALQPCEDSIEAARRTVVISFQGHGSGGMRRELHCGWRAKDSGASGHAAHAWATYADQLPVFHQRIWGQSVIIECRDYLEILPVHDGPETLHFIDPPYVQASRVSRHRYTHDFSNAQHKKLLQAVKRLEGAVILCGYESELYARALSKWEKVVLPARSIMGSRRLEVLWLNKRAAAHRRNLFS